MQAWGITLEQAQSAARAHGLQAIGDDMTPGRGGIARCSFVLKLDTASQRDADGGLPYQRVSMNRHMEGRRVAAVCWHGHRDVMRSMFEQFPTMRLKSALADYRGRQSFEDEYENTYGGSDGWNVGLSYGEACTCDEARQLGEVA